MVADEGTRQDPEGQLPLADEHRIEDPSESRQAHPGGDVPVKPSSRGAPDRSRQQEFYIPIHGFVWLSPQELRVVDHPAFQRLGDVYQLGQVHLVFRGATHRRFEHALGTVHVAQMMINSLQENAEREQSTAGGEWKLDRPLTDAEIAFIRLGALVHDIGHLPSGHTLEDELGLLGKHDEVDRLQLVLSRSEWRGSRVQPLATVIDHEYEAFAKAITSGVTATDVLLAIIAKNASASGKKWGSFRLEVCRDLIGNTICADLLDYLHRDWHHLGKPKHLDTRLIQYMEVRARDPKDPLESRLVVNLREQHKVRTDAVSAILDLLESRYGLAEVALFHKTKLSAAGMLERIVAELGDAEAERSDAWRTNLVDELLDSSDSEMLKILEASARRLIDGQDSERSEGVAALARDLGVRRLHKPIYVASEFELAGEALFRDVQKMYAGQPDPADPEAATASRRTAANQRLAALRLLERDFGLPACSLTMYCPPPKMNTKVANVLIYVDGEVHRLDDYENRLEGERGLTGGHLLAQKLRFRRLWRVQFAMSPTASLQLENTNLLEPITWAIESLCLGRTPGGTSIERYALALAREVAEREGSPLYGKEVGTPDVAARGREVLFYPTGAPSLLSHIGQ
jgi:HD superfamily phosphohydrolase